MGQTNPASYRPDVDGLRAVAILPVVAYHYGVPAFSGGFVGVDVFFVISGFLITSVIDREITGGTFSIRRFYERRVRRIFPALFLVLAAVLALAFVVLLPVDRELVAGSAAAAALFGSNLLFWSRAGYFHRASEADPLLHTWSLGVEEQFYLVFPPLLVVLGRYLPRHRVAVLGALGAASLGASVWTAHAEPTAGFYLLPTRLWELLLGALLALGVVPRPRSPRVAAAVALAGLALIAVAVFTFSSITPFPGWRAALPAGGTLLVIAAGTHDRPLVNRLLSWPPLVFVGLVSYSLYLWHWPVVVLARYYAFPLLGRDLGAADLVALAALSMVLAVASWRFVERPFRDRSVVPDPRVLPLGAQALLATCALAALVGLVPGVPERVVPALAARGQRVREAYPCVNQVDDRLLADGPCPIGADVGPPRYVVWGDSHALALTPGFDLAGRQAGRRGAYATRGACPPLLDIQQVGSVNCTDPWPASLPRLLKDRGYTTVFLALRWNLYATAEGYGRGSDAGLRVFLQTPESGELSPAENRRVLGEALARTASVLTRRGLRVVLVGPVPEVGLDVPATWGKLRLLGRPPTFGPTLGEFEARSAPALQVIRHAAETSGLEVVYPHKALCATGRCATIADGVALYEDDDHLSLAGSRTLAALFEPVLAEP